MVQVRDNSKREIDTILEAIAYQRRVEAVACGVVIILFTALAIVGILSTP